MKFSIRMLEVICVQVTSSKVLKIDKNGENILIDTMLPKKMRVLTLMGSTMIPNKTHAMFLMWALLLLQVILNF